MTKATPSYSKYHGVVVNNVPIVKQSSLHATSPEAVEIGSGRFGACTLMVYKDMFEVCVKQVSEEFSAQAVKSEAAVMLALNCCAFTPHCFGVFSHSIVMAFVNVDGKPVSLHSALRSNSGVVALNPRLCVGFLRNISEGLQYIHGCGFLHNDLKLDNSVR